MSPSALSTPWRADPRGAALRSRFFYSDMRTTKYGNTRTTFDGMRFDSKREAQRFMALQLLERAGRISDLRRQVKFVLIPAQRDDNGKVIERECSYVADFVYVENGREVVEDTKGMRTPDYVIKRKLMLSVHGIAIQET